MMRKSSLMLLGALAGAAVTVIAIQPPAMLTGAIAKAAHIGIVTLMNDRRDKSCIQSRSCRGGDLAPCLHGRGSERPVRLC